MGGKIGIGSQGGEGEPSAYRRDGIEGRRSDELFALAWAPLNRALMLLRYAI
jgi:hypothetical protein